MAYKFKPSNYFILMINIELEENSGKINIQGYAKISLNNTFNTEVHFHPLDRPQT